MKTSTTSAPAPAPVPTHAPTVVFLPWRVSTVLLSGQELLLHFPTLDEATACAKTVLTQGYCIDDRSADSSRYNAVFYPLAQIKSVNVYEVG